MLCRWGGALLLAGAIQLPPSADEIARFLERADIVEARPIGEGSTHPFRLTLSDGHRTHDAAFQSIDERAPMKELETGIELHFVDSYHFNIAAFRLAELLGLDDMVPVSVERHWRRETGSLTWWIEHKWDENEWKASGIDPPDVEAWNRQIYKVRVFTALIYDTDRNRGNNLITEDWKIWMIDFTRAFRLERELKSPEGLVRCDRDLLEKMKGLTREAVSESVGDHLHRNEIDALLARRDLLLAHYDALIRERGAAAVLY